MTRSLRGICRAVARGCFRLARERRGAAAVFIAVGIVPLLAVVGVSVDGACGWLVKSRLGSAVDAAALAGGRVYASPTRDDDIRMYFKANFPDGYMNAVTEPLSITHDPEERTLTVSARAIMPTNFMHLVGIDTVSVSAKAEVTLESQNIEVSLVLDITGSMSGQKIEDLIDAAHELVDIVVQDQQTPFYSKLALVPYSMAVNVGDYADEVRGTYTNNTCTEPAAPTCRYYRFQNASSDHEWTTLEISTCVTERTGTNAYSDVAPSTAPVGRNFPSGQNPCLSNEIVPLTSDKTLLHDRINGFEAVGSTAGHIGIAWGWYMISPNFGYLWPEESRPAPYGTPKLQKVAILMTDGEFNTVYYNGVIAQNSGSGSGSSEYKIDHDSHNGSAFYQAQQLCAVMKAADIVIYAVAFDVPQNSAAYDIMEECATDPTYMYFPENGTALKDAFRDIAHKVSQLRLSK